MRRPPFRIWIPFENVEDALVEVMLMRDDERAPVRIVDVPDTVFKIDPPLMVSPCEDARPPPATERPELVNVEVADERLRMEPSAMVRPLEVESDPALNPPIKVEVPDVREPRTSKNPLMMVEVALLLLPLMYTLPLTASCADPGEVVPMPTLPLESMMNAVEVALAEVVVLVKKRGVVNPANPVRDRRAAGELVAIPMFMKRSTRKAGVVEPM